MQIPGYRIVRKIDQGGMSTVYLAIQLSVGREVALKVMSPALNADPVFSKRFQREANIVGQLSHPNIVSIYDIGCYKNLNYIAMDYLPGGTIHERMKSELSIPETLRIIKEVARALDVAHSKGYVHRDIKPENVLFRPDGTTVLSDFGVAKAISSSSQTTNAGLVVGTPHYMSPEQSRGLAIDGRSDTYSLGIVFYEMLTGSVPYKADEAVAIAIKHVTAPIPILPPQFSIYQSLLNKFIAKRASDRFQTGAEVIDAINQLEDTLSGTTNRRNSATDPHSMNVMALFKALVLTSYAVIKIKINALLKKIVGWRWTPKKGFYHHPQTKVTEIKTNVDSGEDRKVTVVSTRIRKAAYYEYHPNRKVSYVTRTFMFLFVSAIIWSAIAIGLVRFNIVERADTGKFSQVVVSTAEVIEKYTNNITHSETYQDQTIDESNSVFNETFVVEKNAQAIQPEVNIRSNQPAQEAKSLNSEIQVTEELTADIENSVTREVKQLYFSLTITPSPENARVRILNIREKYQPNIRLSPGRYHIEVSENGYHTEQRWIIIKDQNRSENIILNREFIDGQSVVDTLLDGSNGPEMITLPINSFTMGNKDHANTSPEHIVTITKRLAASKYEVTFTEYDKFASAASRSLPADKKWGRDSRPVINVSWEDANAYATWLSQQTGNNYRLPSEAEWEFFARAASTSDFWWDSTNSNIKSAEGSANCKRGCKSEFVGIFSSKSAPVGTYQANPFGLYDTSGNIAEWTADCYQNHYIGVSTDGSAAEVSNCNSRSVRGGSMQDNLKEIANHSRRGVDAEAKENFIGFRLIRELEE